MDVRNVAAGGLLSNVIDINEVRLRALSTTIGQWQGLLAEEASGTDVFRPTGYDEATAPHVAQALDHVKRMLSFAAEAAAGDGDALSRYRRMSWRLQGLLRECERRGRPGVDRSRQAVAEALAYRRCMRELRRRLRC